jgi:2-polyprenyl-3-methyl-5-hydroxy-6-metoxy-1,4-benzoquinol methylase
MPEHDQDAWDQHWSSFSGSASLNPAQNYRRRLVLGQIAALGCQRGRILDVGCGQGDLLLDLSRAFGQASLAGIEPSAEGVRQSKAKVSGARFAQSDLQASPRLPVWARGWADAAVCTEVLEHLDQPQRLLEHLRAALKPGAPLLVSVPSGPLSAFDRHVGHRRHYSRRDLQGLLQGAGYQVSWVRRAGFPFFNLYRLVVISRGEKLAAEAAGEPRGLARLAMRAFDLAFKFNLPSAPWGWQLFALARTPLKTVSTTRRR